MSRQRRYDQMRPPFDGKEIQDLVDYEQKMLDFTGKGIEQVKRGERGPTLADYSVHRDNILTGGVIGRYELLPGNSTKTLIQIVGPDEIAEVISFALVAPFVHNQPDQQQLVFPTDFYASVKFGTGGVDCEFELDWARGQVVSVPASFLQINAVNATDNPAIFQMGALVSMKQLGHGVAPRRTVSIAVAGEAESRLFPIPRFGQRVQVQRVLQSDGTPFQITWYATDGETVLAQTGVGAFQAMSPEWIGNNAQFFSIANQGAPVLDQPPPLFQAVFELSV